MYRNYPVSGSCFFQLETFLTPGYKVLIHYSIVAKNNSYMTNQAGFRDQFAARVCVMRDLSIQIGVDHVAQRPIIRYESQ